MGLQVSVSKRYGKCTAKGSRWHAAAVCCLLALRSAGAQADDNTDPAALRIAVGPAIYALPRFPGSGQSRAIYFPFLDAEYANRLYMSASDLIGVYAYKTDTAQCGAALEWDPNRRQTQDIARLRGLRDVKDTARAKFFASRTVYFVTLEENIATDLLGRGQGTLSQTNLWLTAPVGKTLTINLGPGFTWSDRTYMHTFFTVDPDTAARNPLLTTYAAHAGVSDWHLNGMSEWQWRPRYRLGVLASLARLRGDAAGSPLALQHSQRTLMGWVTYQFR